MDNSAPGISFDEKGVCNYCKVFDDQLEKFPLNQEGQKELEKIVDRIKKEGKNRPYDCIVGVSGGTDSTYTLLKCVELGLRPLAVHFDNGWNSEIAVSNIKKSISKLNVDLYTYVVDWEEFKDLQLSVLKASIPEVEIPTDIAIRKVLYQTAVKHKIKYSISGNCFRAEGLVPHGWGYKDAKYIRSIQKQFGSKPLKTFPNLTLWDYFYYSFIKKIKIVRVLNYFDYSKEEAKKVNTEKLDWVDYGGHHHESIYTRFFMSYLAPVKYKMDRRKVTLSARVRLGKLERSKALEELQTDSYPSRELFEEDKTYIAKKFKISDEEFEEIIARPNKSFHDYPSYFKLIQIIQKVIDFASKFGFLKGSIPFQSGRYSK